MGDFDKIASEFFLNGLTKFDSFDEWVLLRIEQIQPRAIDLVYKLGSKLESEHEKRCQEEYHRDYWELFGDADPVKSSQSIWSKLARDIGSDKSATRLSETQMEDRVFGLSDLGRCRVICTFNKDADDLLEILFEMGRFLNDYECPKGIKDFIFSPERRDGLKGHRARQFSVKVPFDSGRYFGFEIQIMTMLQHAWDRRNHPMYEWTREGGELSAELQVNDFACAETLHLVDRQADHNWMRFKEETKK